MLNWKLQYFFPICKGSTFDQSEATHAQEEAPVAVSYALFKPVTYYIKLSTVYVNLEKGSPVVLTAFTGLHCKNSNHRAVTLVAWLILVSEASCIKQLVSL